MTDKSIDFLDILSILSFIIGLENLRLNQIQVDGIMNEMKEEQNTMLRKIIEQNEEIIALLKGKNYAQKNDK